ncbi:Major facilitator superfamily domain general substrate transporter [Penicillium concentricum]|uniref:Major facilitator superfamily domain general substrate transporter n=1 Tax=Penicillium concentricum TaxID=293559 RepID=A0A9W9V9L3_9EURO|nr:Major facilitator superfamily domain general substrate transporter [Penicillium concentricum]KAJ5373872.1 Major facilitator superfamily domain general substrate transporter [Penicillium concentricum]
MASPNERADPIPDGMFATARQSIGDLFIWKQRVEVTNEHGETYAEWQEPERIQNPFSLMAQLSARDWVFFLVGLIAWTADAFDFHALSIQTVKLATYYERSKTDITTAITLTLLLRSVGAAFFGLAGDKYGRKWPMVLNMIILGILQIATIYSKTFQQFLAVRSLFGLFMGGVYGNAISMALEHCPVNARGLMSGILQQGYSLGYVFAACANLGVGGATDSWKTVFWIAAGISIAVGFIRICFPESQSFIEAKKAGKRTMTAGEFWRETISMLGKEWRMCIYCVILMTWFNFYSHTSQDSYTTFMLTAKELDNDSASRASILMKTGACVGGTIIGYLSQFFGRRRAIVVAAFVSGVLIPAWILPEGERSLSVTGFFMQFFVQGAWGVIPVHLNELSPPAFRSSFTGLTYQIGNMISSPSSQIVNAISESTFITSAAGHRVEAYGPVMGVATAIIALGIMFTTAVGPEKRGRRFETVVAGVDEAANAKTMDLETGAGDHKPSDETIEMADQKK